MQTFDDIYNRGYKEGSAIARITVNDIPHIGEMFPERLYDICKTLQIPVDVAVSDSTKEIENVYYAFSNEVFDGVLSRDEDIEELERLSEFVDFDVLNAFNAGVGRAFEDVWVDTYLEAKEDRSDKFGA